MGQNRHSTKQIIMRKMTCHNKDHYSKHSLLATKVNIICIMNILMKMIAIQHNQTRLQYIQLPVQVKDLQTTELLNHICSIIMCASELCCQL